MFVSEWDNQMNRKEHFKTSILILSYFCKMYIAYIDPFWEVLKWPTLPTKCIKIELKRGLLRVGSFIFLLVNLMHIFITTKKALIEGFWLKYFNIFLIVHSHILPFLLMTGTLLISACLRWLTWTQIKVLLTS